ncbi:MAG: FCD domain-containing protein, partial [candidate division NC10 bacterium]
TLHETWRGMQRRTRAFVASTNLANDNLHVVARRHRAIFNALASRAITGSRKAMRAHFAHLEQELDILLAEQKPGGGGTRVKGPRRRRTTL